MIRSVSKHLLALVIGSHVALMCVLVAMNSGCFYINTDPKDAPEAFRIPEIKKAYQDKKAIESQSVVVKQLGQELDGLVTNTSSHVPIISGVNTRSEFISTVQSLRREAQVILDSAPKFIAAVDRLSTDMSEGRQSFSAAAKLFETFAAEEPYEGIADDYRQIVKMFTTLSERCETAQSQIIDKHDRAAFLETVQFIKHQELLLHRLEAALLATFENADVLEVQQYLAQLTSYTKRYEDFRLQIRDLNRLVPMLQAPSTGLPAAPENQKSQKTPPAAASDSPNKSVAERLHSNRTPNCREEPRLHATGSAGRGRGSAHDERTASRGEKHLQHSAVESHLNVTEYTVRSTKHADGTRENFT